MRKVSKVFRVDFCHLVPQWQMLDLVKIVAFLNRNTVEDPGFPKRGVLIPQKGAPIYYFGYFFSKTA